MRGRLLRFGRLLVVDVAPLRASRDYRWLYAGQLTSFLARELTVVAVPYQAFLLTGSSLVVGLLGLVQLIPGLAIGLVGGAIADAMDRRKLLLVSQILQALVAAGLMWNALAPVPALWPLFVLSALNAGLASVDSPTRMAAIPNMVGRDLLPAALALNQTISNLGTAIGPALAGLVIASWGLGFSFGLEAVMFGLSALSVLGISALPPGAEKATMGLKAIAEGLRYLRGQRRIMSTFAIDINAMLFGMPRALFPAIGTELFGGDASTVGLLYAAPGAGALIAAFTSGWVGTVRRRGRMIVGSVVVWGIAIALFGLVHSLPLALSFLAVAGAADVVSAVFRNTIVQLTVPNHLRGRISGIHVAVVRSGPRLGDLESGAVAALTSEQVSVVSGGIACVLGALLVARVWPELLAGDEPPSLDPG